jgi:hypothetical protein
MSAPTDPPALSPDDRRARALAPPAGAAAAAEGEPRRGGAARAAGGGAQEAWQGWLPGDGRGQGAGACVRHRLMALLAFLLSARCQKEGGVRPVLVSADGWGRVYTAAGHAWLPHDHGAGSPRGVCCVVCWLLMSVVPVPDVGVRPLLGAGAAAHAAGDGASEGEGAAPGNKKEQARGVSNLWGGGGGAFAERCVSAARAERPDECGGGGGRPRSSSSCLHRRHVREMS